jgi:Flp pilus assembly protein TadD
VEASAAGSADQLTERGWGQVDQGNTAAAVSTFEQALAIDDDHAVANYGLGYVLLEQRRVGEANTRLCRALSHAQGDTEVIRDVTGLLSEHGLTCP